MYMNAVILLTSNFEIFKECSKDEFSLDDQLNLDLKRIGSGMEYMHPYKKALDSISTFNLQNCGLLFYCRH